MKASLSDRKIIYKETRKLNKVPSSLDTQYVVVDDADDNEQDDKGSEQDSTERKQGDEDSVKKIMPISMKSLGSQECVSPSVLSTSNFDNCHVHDSNFNNHTQNAHNIMEVEGVQGEKEILENEKGPVSVTHDVRNPMFNLDKTLSLKMDTALLVTSSGPSAEYWGGMLGIYKKAGTHNNCPYYKLVDTERSDGVEQVIYRLEEIGWAFGPGLDGSTALENASMTVSVPLTGWTCWIGDKFIDDPHLRISYDEPPSCGEITIRLSGDAAVKQPWCVGVYSPTQMFSSGRPVFKHQTQGIYLLVRPGYSSWRVQESVESEWSWMQSGCAPTMCPADPRAQTSERNGQESWRYPDNGWKHGDITVKCSIHKY